LSASGDGVQGELTQIVFNGATTSMLIELPGGGVLRADSASRSGSQALQPGARVIASWRAEDAIVFPGSAA